jgi:hypothetical protein
MKKHKVIVNVVERIYTDDSYLRSNGHVVATYERIYPSKSAAINNAREIGHAKLIQTFRHDGFFGRSARYELNVHVEDVENGKPFNYVERAGLCDYTDVADSYDAVTYDKAVDMLDARGFQRIF